jgi:acyl dehydratase
MVRFASLPALLEGVGTELGSSRWIDVDQARIDGFAEVTEDRQWIHVDAVRAAAGPFQTTIAHGFLTLSLLSALVEDLLEVEGISAAINYGLNRVRFPSPVPVGSRVRGTGVLQAVTAVDGGVQAQIRVTVSTEDGAKPACVAELLIRYYA